MHTPNTVHYTPQIKDDYDGLDTRCKNDFSFFFQLGASHPSLSHFLCSVQAYKPFYSCHSNLRQAYLFCVFFFFLVYRKLGS